MTAVANTAATFYPQFDDKIVAGGIPCTVFNVSKTGNLVDAFVRKPATFPLKKELFTVNNVAWVDLGQTPPSSGYFITPTNFVFPTVQGTPVAGTPDETGSEEG